MTTHSIILAHFNPNTKPPSGPACPAHPERSRREPTRHLNSRLPRKFTKCVPTHTDPYRRLLAAIATQALVDLIWPTKNLDSDDIASALNFIIDERDLYLDYFGIPIERYNALLEALDA